MDMRLAPSALVTLLLSGCAPLERFRFVDSHMGTAVRIILYADGAHQADEAARAAYKEFAELDARMSDYRADSELNRLASATGPQEVSPELFEVLQASVHYSELSGGAFDVTVGPLVRLWRQARREKKLPDAAALRAALERVGYRNLVLDAARRRVEVKRPDLQLDLGAIAKGYACDRALAVLRRHGVRRAMVDAGGGMALGDPPPGERGWKIQLADEADKILVLANVGVATSGDWDQYVEVGGKRYSHIVDTKTGLGLTSRATVTVIAPDGLKADALSTTLSVLGPERGLKLAEDLPATEAWVKWSDEGKVRTAQTTGFASHLQPPAP